MAAALQHGASSWHCDGEDIAPWGKDGDGDGGDGDGGLLIWADTANNNYSYLSEVPPRLFACSLPTVIGPESESCLQTYGNRPPTPTPSPRPTCSLIFLLFDLNWNTDINKATPPSGSKSCLIGC